MKDPNSVPTRLRAQETHRFGSIRLHDALNLRPVDDRCVNGKAARRDETIAIRPLRNGSSDDESVSEGNIIGVPQRLT